jgi:hypothetical protein
VGWDSKRADLAVSSQQADPQKRVFPAQLYFFMQYDGPPYTGSEQDANSLSGIMRVDGASSIGASYDKISKCPTSGYTVHWFDKIEKGGVYCVRARDGGTFGKIRVVQIYDDRVAFDWTYQPVPGKGFHQELLPRFY